MSEYSPIVIGVDDVFRALKDAHRRTLLDALFARDGQTLSDLCDQLPGMTRYGVMNHLGVLEDAGLVTTMKVGRQKLHYLNPVPIRLVHDRWIDKFTEPTVGVLAGMTTGLDRRPSGRTPTSQEERVLTTPTHVHETYIRCTVDDAWQAIVDGDRTVQYFYGTRVESAFLPGEPIRYLSADGNVVADGEVLTIDEPKRLELTFHPRWDPELEAEGAVRQAWIVDDVNGLTRVRVEYYDLDPTSATYADFAAGIPFIVAGMKTLLETGEPLTDPVPG